MKNQTASALDQLPRYQPRQFLPESTDLTQTETAIRYYQQLLDTSPQTSDELRTLLLNRSELEAAIAQVQSILYIQMTCQTDDTERAAAYKAFIETVMPALKPLNDRLDRKIMRAIDATGFNDSYYDLYFRKMRSDIDIFRQDNVPLQTEDALLSQEYQTVTGAMTVTFDGGEHTIPQMRKYQLNTSRDIRERSWRATSQRYLQDSKPLNDIFDKMIAARHQIAQNAGFANFRDYKFIEWHRFSYTPDDCKRYHRAIETCLVPVQRHVLSRRAEQLGLETLRPWDMTVDPLGREAMRPFESTADFIAGLGRMFAAADDEFGAGYRFMQDNGLLDLESRKGKAPGGYQSCLNEARKPFIFMNATGINDDLRVLMHEGGHAFHTLSCADKPLVDYRHGPLEFCEVASMSMELLTAPHLSVCYDEVQQARWWRGHLETIIRILISVAVNDAFQHWLYENPTHTVDHRAEKWLEINDRFGCDVVDWSGLRTERAAIWQRTPHFYQTPFYYIEYGIAQLGALGIWLQSKQDMDKAIANYKKALALGGSQPLPDLFAAAELEFDFSEKTVRPLSEMLLAEWKKYSDE
ncbi:MAG: M3 family oligoendopeptidase [Planctomycetota bacterium]